MDVWTWSLSRFFRGIPCRARVPLTAAGVVDRVARGPLQFAAHFAMVEISGEFWMQLVVSALGILIMIAVAALLSWYKKTEGRSSGSRPKKMPDADLAGGEA